MSPLRFVDTNILLYSISHNPAEAAKRDIAIELLESDDLAVSVQVLQEFYVQATRPSRSYVLPHDLAVAFIHTWLRFPVQDMSVPVLLGALEIKARYAVSYLDAAIVAAARALGCRELLSEDMAHGRLIDSVLIRNPFR